MADNGKPQNPGVNVEGLRLRLPGQSAAGGRRVAEQAMAMVAQRLPAGLTGDVPAIKLRVRAAGASEARLSAAIAEAVIATLAKHGAGRRRDA